MPDRNDDEVTSSDGSCEFRCRDCGQEVYRPVWIGMAPDSRCFVCGFVASLDPADRDEARSRLHGAA